MKRLRIYYRVILTHTGYREYPFKEEIQLFVEFGKDHFIKTGDAPDPRDKNIKVKYSLILDTRKKSDLDAFLENPPYYFKGKRTKVYKILVTMIDIVTAKN